MKTKISKIECFSQCFDAPILEYLSDNQTLVIFDADLLLLDDPESSFSIKHVKQNPNLLAELFGHSPGNMELDIFHALLDYHTKNKIVAPGSIEFAQMLSKDGAKCIAISSSIAVNLEIDDHSVDLASAKLQKLIEHGFQFSDFGIIEHKVLDSTPYLGALPIFKSGLMLTNGEYNAKGQPTKGQAVVNLLTMLAGSMQPSNIIYIDNNIGNIHIVQDALALIDDSDINFLGIHFTGLNLQPKCCNNVELSMIWQTLVALVPDILARLNLVPLEAHFANDVESKVAPDGSKISFLTTGMYGGVVQCSLAPNQKSESKKHRTVSEMWAFKGRMQIDIWKSDSAADRPHRISIINPNDYLIVSINAGESFKFINTISSPAKFLIATVPTWPGSNEAISVPDLEPPTRCGAIYRLINTSYILNGDLERIWNVPVIAPRTYTTNILGDGIKVKTLATINGAIFYEYTIKANTESHMRESETEEHIVAGQDIDGLQLLRSYGPQHSSLLRFSQTLDNFASANIPIGVSYKFLNDTSESRKFLVLAMKISL